MRGPQRPRGIAAAGIAAKRFRVTSTEFPSARVERVGRKIFFYRLLNKLIFMTWIKILWDDEFRGCADGRVDGGGGGCAGVRVL